MEQFQMEQLMNERETAKLLRISVQLLRKWRAHGTGPEHIKMGKCVRYEVREVKRYIASHVQARTGAPV